MGGHLLIMGCFAESFMSYVPISQVSLHHKWDNMGKETTILENIIGNRVSYNQSVTSDRFHCIYI